MARQEYRRDSHLFLKNPTQSNAEISRHVAGEFCKAYAKQFGVVATVIDVETDSVDAVLRVGDIVVAIELVSYRQRDEHYDIEHADSHIKELISSRWATSALPLFEIRIWWAKEQRVRRSAGQSTERTKVPRGRTATEFVDEVVKLAIQAPNDGLCNKHIGFCDDPERRKRRPLPKWTFVKNPSFPCLSNYCFWIEVTPWPHCFLPTIRTSVDLRTVGLDRAQLAEAIRQKLGKLNRYRHGVCGTPLWLTAHSDGHPLSTRLPPGLHESALQVIRGELQRVACSFDRVWWAENTGFLDAARLYEVLPVEECL